MLTTTTATGSSWSKALATARPTRWGRSNVAMHTVVVGGPPLIGAATRLATTSRPVNTHPRAEAGRVSEGEASDRAPSVYL